jgi:hypothetical protein
MNKEELYDTLKHSSSDWLYVITWDNMLKQLLCPFKVIVLSPVGLLRKGQLVMVKQVMVTMDLKTVFIIDGSAYYYYHFNILID